MVTCDRQVGGGALHRSQAEHCQADQDNQAYNQRNALLFVMG
jgi:hypothetical protein